MSSNISNTTHLGAHFLPDVHTTTKLESAKCSYEPKFRFREQPQLCKYPKTQHLKIAIAEKIEKKEYFYGIEILARSYNSKLVLDYTKFGKMLPLFTSIVWLGLDYSRITNVEKVGSVRVAKKLKDKQHEMLIAPHLSCYGLDTKRLNEFIKLNFTNIVIVRGDQYDNEQEFKYASQLVAQIKRECQDSITIAVAGHPEGHPSISTMQEDMKFLVEKISVGADLIITQVCFNAQSLIDFIKTCRLNSINIPIILGIFVPDNIKSLLFLMELTKIEMLPEDLEQYRYYAEKGKDEFRFFAAQKVTQMILTVLEAENVNIYGIHFFTMNKFGMVTKVLEELRKYIKI
uniref:Uncharacterized protein n=1 Tax=Glossina brevipalpis TaxID=37001 RepID=A0A1A9W1W7_9MUSC